jgi:hypothetical protein
MTEQEIKDIDSFKVSIRVKKILDGISNLLTDQDFWRLTNEQQVDMMNTPLKELIEIIYQTNAIKSINEDIKLNQSRKI